MIILLPVSTEQTISIMPRKEDFLYDSEYSSRVSQDNGTVESISCIADIVNTYNDVDVYIRRDGDGKEETITNVPITLNSNFINLSFSCSILEEGSTYFIEATSLDNLIYRDKIFSTSQTDYKIKHTISQGNYTPYSSTDDNTYII